MFRARIYAQAFTIAAMVAGSMYWQTDRQKQKELEKLLEERKAQVKREKWIEELEYRDREAKEEQARKDAAIMKRVIAEEHAPAKLDALSKNSNFKAGNNEKMGVVESVNRLISESK